ncbi:GltD NADPH-dependent glutamate synthase beta chain and related oxidoreductases [Candidatus Methylopumilus universalis]|uniref:glutamate synthase subunit beta n=1 Tax=Candidatus Methylopumilus universalis TaxID=2588536 RepID=UPI003BEF491A
MGKVTGFMEFDRISEQNIPPQERLKNYKEFVLHLSDDEAKKQGARCMDCGIPFCTTGCPINNIIPDWNDLIYNQNWEEAIEVLHSTNNFPEFTGRLCPAPCEAACTLNINDDAVGIKSIEHAIIDKAWENNWVKPLISTHKTNKKIAIVGSGPAGMAAAQQLARVGHAVTVYEKNDRIGGLLRYGIPDFKMEKTHIDRRMKQMEAEGVVFKVNQNIGENVKPDELTNNYDAVILAGGAEHPRDLPVPGRELNGVMFAMNFLPQQNKVVAGDKLQNQILATGKHVVVIGGGDTGSDCVGTSNRHHATSVTQFELMPQPPVKENKEMVWPNWPLKLRTSSSHEEGCERDWSVTTKSFVGENGNVKEIIAARVEWKDGKMVEVPNSEFILKADLVLLAMGFVSPQQKMLDLFGVDKDQRGNVKATTEGKAAYITSKAKVFAAGDIRRGQSLIVWAIREGRQCARAVDEFLMGTSTLPR